MPTYNQLQSIGRELTAKEVDLISKAIATDYRALNKQLQGIIRVEYNKIIERDIIVGSDEYIRELKKRIPAITAKTQRAIQKTLKKVNAQTIQSSTVGISNNYYRQQYAMSWFSPLGTSKTLLDFTFIDPIAVHMSVTGTTSRWKALEASLRKRKLKGFVPKGDRPTLSSLLLKNSRRTLKRIQQGITQGIIEGQGISKMASNISHNTGIAGRELRRIVRTETHRNVAAGQYAAYLDAKEQGLVANRQVRAVLDTRTRLQSSQVDGQLDVGENNTFIYPGGVLVAYPGNSGVAEWDINDREYVIDIIDGVAPNKRIARNPDTGLLEEATYDSFDDWRKSKGLVYKKGILVKK
jgi:hypothetical protein